MAETLAWQILEAVRARLVAATVANGFHYDVGLALRADRIEFDRTALQVAVFSSRETTVPGPSGLGAVAARMVFTIEGRLPIQPVAATDDPPEGLQVEQLVEDIQRAVELPDRSLGGLAPGKLRYRGRNTFSRYAGPDAYVLLEYEVEYHRGYGRPSARA